MIPVTLTELRSNIARYFDRAEADRETLVVTRRGREPMVVIPLSELEGLRETLHLLGNEANATHLRESIAELDAGRGSERTLVEG